ncbi:membrane protein insertion efficiency factor YidD [Polaromonas sp.]|uniref:membrane protein insertion efficiency factor YidD n=1 Tax=Polaromonas sp. TaxID=1869339 RepID=UPI0013BCA958|nr:membrane protein insertion efficiency factor YidD [Polaromonas sp.]NDP63167.1 membrane protein insertion efficiency factor YidD [Polaromonas sp.]
MRRILIPLVHLPQKALMGMVTAYRLLISPSLGSNCRFEPSCSAYSLQALSQHGAVTGSYLTLRRLVRCHPWCDGGHDPVPPPQSASFFSRLLTPAALNSSKKTPS